MGNGERKAIGQLNCEEEITKREARPEGPQAGIQEELAGRTEKGKGGLRPLARMF